LLVPAGISQIIVVRPSSFLKEAGVTNEMLGIVKLTDFDIQLLGESKCDLNILFTFVFECIESISNVGMFEVRMEVTKGSEGSYLLPFVFSLSKSFL
jgi:hypothetical protein